MTRQMTGVFKAVIILYMNGRKG